MTEVIKPTCFVTKFVKIKKCANNLPILRNALNESEQWRSRAIIVITKSGKALKREKGEGGRERMMEQLERKLRFYSMID